MLIRLTQDERIEARQQAMKAVQALAGERPHRGHYTDTVVSKYPDWLIKLVVGLCAGLLVVAFIPSSIRLWHIGSETFGEADGIDSKVAMQLVGYCVVLLAEIGAVLFTIAWAVLDTKRTTRLILGLSIMASAAIALIGNFEIGIWRAGNVTLFTWLETLLPPFLTLSTAFILKEVSLDKIRHRHADNTAYDYAVREWELVFNAPEQHPRFNQVYANALRDKLRDVNSSGRGAGERIKILNTLRRADWIQLVQVEMNADNWFAPAESIELDVDDETQPVQTVQPERAQPILNAPAMASTERPLGFAMPHEYSRSTVRATVRSSVQTPTPAERKGKTEQLAELLLNDPELRSMSYSQILNDPRVAQITTTKGTVSAAFKMINDGGEG